MQWYAGLRGKVLQKSGWSLQPVHKELVSPTEKMVESTWSKLTDLKALLSFSKSPDWVNMGQSCDLRTGLPKALQQANQGCKE